MSILTFSWRFIQSWQKTSIQSNGIDARKAKSHKGYHGLLLVLVSNCGAFSPSFGPQPLSPSKAMPECQNISTACHGRAEIHQQNLQLYV